MTLRLAGQAAGEPISFWRATGVLGSAGRNAVGRSEATARPVDQKSSPMPSQNVPPASERTERSQFSIGETVALRSDPSRIGVVTSTTTSNRKMRYGVFIDGRIQNLYASQIMPAAPAPASVGATLEELNARLTALQLVAPSLETSIRCSPVASISSRTSSGRC